MVMPKPELRGDVDPLKCPRAADGREPRHPPVVARDGGGCGGRKKREGKDGERDDAREHGWYAWFARGL